MKNKRFGFTIMELLVVIVIIGILASITVPTFGNYVRKTYDAGRTSAVHTMTLVIKADGGDQWRNEKYMYSVDNLKEIFNENDSHLPQGKNGVCYLIAMAHNSNSSIGDNNEFGIVTWGATTSTANSQLSGAIIDGTSRFVDSIKDSLISIKESKVGMLDAGDFSCELFHFTDVIARLDSVVADNSDLNIAYYMGISETGELVSIGGEYE